MHLIDHVLARLQYLYPGRLLSAAMYRATRIRYGPFKNWQTRWFIRRYRVDMSLAQEPDPTAYRDFNAFFARSLRPETGPDRAGHGDIISPVDGTISEIGAVTEGRLLQAKRHTYALAALLGNDRALAESLNGGQFATLYLSPRDYHRVHLPVSGRLTRMLHVPGTLFSVNPATTNVVPGLFTRNERVIMRFDTALGAMAVVMVGALFVGGIETVWSGPVTPRPGRRPTIWDYDDSNRPAPRFERGEEIARFNMGSTVIVVLPPGPARWGPELHAGRSVRMGQVMGRWLADEPGPAGG